MKSDQTAYASSGVATRCAPDAVDRVNQTVHANPQPLWRISCLS